MASSVVKTAVAAVVVAGTCGALIPLSLHGQDSPPATAPALVDQTGPLKTDDLVSVTINGLIAHQVATQFISRLDSEGMIYLPVVGVFKVGGQTRDEAEKAINRAYRERNLLPDAEIHVARLQEAAKATVRSGPFAKQDRVRVRIWGLERDGSPTVVEAEVSDTGPSLPKVGHVQMAGMTEFEAARKVVDAYRERRVLPNAMVEVLCTGRGMAKP